MAASGKQYGLFFPKKLIPKNVGLIKHSAFADDSDEDTSVGESLKKESLKKRVMKQTKLEIQKALQEDASVYEYDNVYDDIQQKKKEENEAKVLAVKDKKPKYIQNLLKAVEVRKKEQEKRMEKKIQKERETEGEEFKDKEAFVTSAYKKRLQEKAEEEERERREAALEASLDVTKQKDLSGFYRHLLNQSVGEEEMPECSLRDAGMKREKSCSDEPFQETHGEENWSAGSIKKEENLDADSDFDNESSEEEVTHGKKPEKKESHIKEERSKDHRIRRRSGSSSEESDDNQQQKRRHNEASNTRQMERDKYKKDREYNTKDRDFKEKQKHGDHDRYRNREEQDYRVREKKDRSETHHSRKDTRRSDASEKEKERNAKDDRYREREKDRGQKHKENEGDERRREREDKNKQRDKERSDRSDKEAKPRDKKERSPSTSYKHASEPKRNLEEGGKEEEAAKESCGSNISKFAKRCNEETVVSARDRYLARQMARVGAKAYVEKEED
ncbi:hypothetical protein GDO86_002914 [Hymenochirus boettgeri]|uniref:Nuclear speckle splicing regulatory protein 1 n=1 Tax=Hymenochirus boettgeri TaxID=247094 RepID=A0A8T2K2Y3_9PIPI|nr:hypothetical protein GDO86_002914 [Hymenochirus boettgeri]